MKACILGNTGKNVRTAYSWFCKTTAQGLMLNNCNVVGYDYKSHTIDQIYNFLRDGKFDILFTHLTFHRHHNTEKILEIFDEIRTCLDTKIIHTMQDARTEPRYKGDISFAFDMALVGQIKNIPKFKKYWKIPVYYFPYASMTYDRMGYYKKELDFRLPVFPGNPNSHPDRADFLKKLQSKMRFKIISTKSPEDIRKETLNFSKSNPCVLGFCTRYEQPLYGYYEVRPWQYLGAGACMILRPYKGFENVIDPKLYYSINSYSVNDAERVAKYWKKIQKENHDSMRENAFNFVQKYHSSMVRIKQVIEILEDKREKLNIFLDEI